MSAKIICFFVMVIAFFSFYQQNPLFTLGIIFVVIIGFLFYKKRKSGKRSMGSPYMGQIGSRSSKYEKILSLLMVTQLMNTKSFSEGSTPSASPNSPTSAPESKDVEYEKEEPIGLNVRDMILDLLQEE